MGSFRAIEHGDALEIINNAYLLPGTTIIYNYKGKGCITKLRGMQGLLYNMVCERC